jgi:hypothetical protein
MVVIMPARAAGRHGSGRAKWPAPPSGPQQSGAASFALLPFLVSPGIPVIVAMIFLVIAGALVPSGSGPGPVELARTLRLRLARARRYSQITRIAVRHGLGPCLRGAAARPRGFRAAPVARRLVPAGARRRRGHLRQARPAAVHPARPASRGVRHRACPVAGLVHQFLLTFPGAAVGVVAVLCW